MDTEELSSYIRQQLHNGAKPEDIKKSLLDGGWIASDIDKALAAYSFSDVASQANDRSAANAPVSSPAGAETAQKSQNVSAVREVSFPREKEVLRVERVARAAREAKEAQSFRRMKFSFRFIITHPYFRPFVIATVFCIVVGVGGYIGFGYIKSHWRSNGESATPMPPSADGLSPAVKIDENAELFRQLFGLQLATTTYENKTVVYPFVNETNTITVKGTLGSAFVGYAVRYAVYDIPSGLFVPIVNSSLDNVDAALKPFLGATVTVLGTHAAGSREITITTLNGKPI